MIRDDNTIHIMCTTCALINSFLSVILVIPHLSSSIEFPYIVIMIKTPTLVDVIIMNFELAKVNISLMLNYYKYIHIGTHIYMFTINRKSYKCVYSYNNSI